MRKYTKVIREENILDEVICDICGKKIEKDSFGYIKDHIHIDKVWGYNSGRDGEHTEMDICESCFDKLKK